MASSRNQRTGESSVIGNPEPPMSAPARNLGHDHSFMLQAVMEMQKSIGALESSVNNLASQIGSQKQSIEDLKKKTGSTEKVMYAASVILIIAISLGGWMLTAAKDFAMTYYKASIEAQVKTVPPPTKP